MVSYLLMAMDEYVMCLVIQTSCLVGTAPNGHSSDSAHYFNNLRSSTYAVYLPGVSPFNVHMPIVSHSVRLSVSTSVTSDLPLCKVQSRLLSQRDADRRMIHLSARPFQDS
jgi:hypothetical protein